VKPYLKNKQKAKIWEQGSSGRIWDPEFSLQYAVPTPAKENKEKEHYMWLIPFKDMQKCMYGRNMEFGAIQAWIWILAIESENYCLGPRSHRLGT
jgi:hypothetical protein